MRASILIVMLACGRISFEPTSRGSGAGDGANGGSGSNAGDGGAVCAYHACPMNQIGCCEGGTNTCMDAQACTGQIVECDPVTSVPCMSPNTYCCQIIGTPATSCTLANMNCN